MRIADYLHIAPPEPGLASSAFVERASQLVPYLREKAAQIESAGYIPEEVEQKLRRAGFYRMLQPRNAGGYEVDLDTFISTMIELFRGDGSAGWIACFMAAHILWICALSKKAQREIFADHGDVRTILPGAPTGKACPVDGGYRITGRWDYCSGYSLGNWLVSVAQIDRGVPAKAAPELIFFATRCSNARIDGGWNVLGLKGTGSVTCVIDDLHVPTEFTASFPRMIFEFEAPGHGTFENPFYRSPVQPILWMQLGIALIGMTRGLIDIFVDEVSKKNNPSPMRDDKKVQIALGHAIAKHDVAKSALHQMSINQTKRVERIAQGRQNEWSSIQADHLLIGMVSRLCTEAAEELFFNAGTRIPISSDCAFQRFYRDIKVAATHRAVYLERAAENYGMIALGLTPTTKS